MNNFVLELWDDESQMCTFYTVNWEDASANETDKFFEKYDAIPEYKQAVQQLLSFILDSIGEDYGAIPALFNRFENEVVGLPVKGKARLEEVTFHYPSFPLRLYALRIQNRTDLVVLFNGGVKIASTNQQSEDLNLKWVEACVFARRIEEALKNRIIEIDEVARAVVPGLYVNDEIIL